MPARVCLPESGCIRAADLGFEKQFEKREALRFSAVVEDEILEGL